MAFRKVTASIEAWCPPAEDKTIVAKLIAFREQEKGEIVIAELTKPCECFPAEEEEGAPKRKKGEKRTDSKVMPAGTIVGMSFNYALADLKKYEAGALFMIEWKRLKDIPGGQTVWDGDLSLDDSAKLIVQGKVPF
jgi:hypothetical protein